LDLGHDRGALTGIQALGEDSIRGIDLVKKFRPRPGVT
jgi:hypothetical protein